MATGAFGRRQYSFTLRKARDTLALAGLAAIDMGDRPLAVFVGSTIQKSRAFARLDPLLIMQY
jgi:hypothetical protein